MKEITVSDPVRDVNDRLFIHEDEQLKRWNGDAIPTVRNHITTGETPRLVHEMAHCNGWSTSLNRTKIIFAIKAIAELLLLFI